MRIILIGFMGSGKTTLGKKIANKLNISFIDSDQEIEKLEGRSIQEIFNEFGEKYFRTLEKNFVQSLKTHKQFVLSTGGGMPCFNSLMDELNQLGNTCYIKLHPKELLQRLSNAKNATRPLLQEKSKEELEKYIEKTLKQREGTYLNAKFIIDRDERNAVKILKKIGLGDLY